MLEVSKPIIVVDVMVMNGGYRLEVRNVYDVTAVPIVVRHMVGRIAPDGSGSPRIKRSRSSRSSRRHVTEPCVFHNRIQLISVKV